MFQKLALESKKIGDNIYDKYINKNYNSINQSTFKLPVAKINNLNVDVELYYSPPSDFIHLKVDFIIKSKKRFRDEDNDIDFKLLFVKTFYGNSEKDKNMELCEYEKMFETIYEILAHLKLDKIQNKFTINNYFAEQDELQKLLTHQNTELSTCCVCNDLGGMTTYCNHIICLECFDKLVPAKCNHIDCGLSDCDIETICFHCPICRKLIGLF
jgi:hypothetical protein